MAPVDAAVLARTADFQAVDELPSGLDDALFRGPLIEMSRTRGLVSIPGIARYLLDADGVRAAPAPGSTEDDTRCFLANTVRALDLVMHDVYCLRAAAVGIGDHAVLVCGPSGSGKSVLAAELALRGHPLLADQLAPIVPRPGGALIWPTDEAVQLWPRAADRFHLPDDGAQIVRPALPKRAHRFGDPSARDPVPIGLLVVLGTAPPDTAVAAQPLDAGVGRLRALATWQLHRPPAERLSPLAVFDWLAAVGSAIPSIVVSRPRDVWTAAELADEIEQAAA